MVSKSDIVRALEAVRDPELDIPITELGLIDSITTGSGEVVEVTIRMPTYWCSPNFTYMIVEDARKALEKLVGPARVKVFLKDHHDGERITKCVNSGLRFEECYPEEAGEGLEGLRARMREKAFLARLHGLIRILLRKGLTLGELERLRLEDLEVSQGSVTIRGAKRITLESMEADRIVEYIGMLREAGVTRGPLLRRNLRGEPLGKEKMELLFSRARLTASTLSFNAELCKLLMNTRKLSSTPRGKIRGRAIAPDPAQHPDYPGYETAGQEAPEDQASP
ncbi:hypothetical protein APE_2242.1 [Aeropyrum pernix K1]|uniref:MIP18 family-like domain-containing protein n=1 Tax=Aeropyrum pernix (strain ATCC 700893 / DSM 11879 / JCM 9820 / NBRC 100138 / K1) TaxID=272557 RepID=Q9Y9P6_AERPE|nr:iron-sulfur cluster assembly protein [Aeropyrum pernix]BAA81254.2 hypothetical protein APE_2242.1 [Aeropyrum pernix K1]